MTKSPHCPNRLNHISKANPHPHDSHSQPAQKSLALYPATTHSNLMHSVSPGSSCSSASSGSLHGGCPGAVVDQGLHHIVPTHNIPHTHTHKQPQPFAIHTLTHTQTPPDTSGQTQPHNQIHLLPIFQYPSPSSPPFKLHSPNPSTTSFLFATL